MHNETLSEKKKKRKRKPQALLSVPKAYTREASLGVRWHTDAVAI